ncbi:hypothetical protein VTP01DRAFT_4403 [Rhizomucor pusillus]|uniref:uncharacterized protein n=1 Tax=Rhizomucor pusillus TaxID=4840 RepID=UPI003743927F
MSGSSPQSATTPSTPIRITSGHTYKRRYRPYFTKRQLSALLHLKQPGSTLASKEISARNSSCKFMEQVGKKLGFPQETISTAQALYHRFYLYYSIRHYPPQDISVTCLYVASKIEETHKKLKDIFVAVYSVRYPDSKELDPEHVSEERRRRIVGYEKLLLETLCFDFQHQHPYEYIVKFAKWIQLHESIDGKILGKKAYELAVYSYRIPLCIEYPAHTIAAGCIYLASILLKEEDQSFQSLPGHHPWDKLFCSRMIDIEDVCQQILDLHILNCSNEDGERYTKIKIRINEQARKRGSDPNIMNENDDVNNHRTKWEFEGMSPLEVVNTNQHTI